VFGYELLFRNGIEDYFNADPDLAARSMLDSSLLFGLNTLCHNSRAFLNCTREILLRDLITLLPPSQTAEKLETPHEFYQARNMGFGHFQGYFFCKPELVVGRELPANRVRHLRLLEMVSRPEIDLRELESLLKQEASICYRLLRYLNSPVFGFSLEIKSVRHAMAILGERELRRWIRLIVTVGAAEQGCSELVLMGMTRARFCELLSTRLLSSNDLFLMGLLSIMDAILEIDMSTLLAQVPVDREIKAALLGQSSSLRPLHQLMLAQESGEWDKSTELAKQLNLTDEEVGETWWQALTWAQEVTTAV
jgi:EAL and modified HD-GYP domain-containing signal transduction protein